MWLTIPHKCVQSCDRCLNRCEDVKKFNPKSSEAAFSAVFSNIDNCRPQIASDVISGVSLGYVGVDVRAKFGDSRLNSGRII